MRARFLDFLFNLILKMVLKRSSLSDFKMHQKLKGAQVWDFDVLDFNDFFIMKSL